MSRFRLDKVSLGEVLFGSVCEVLLRNIKDFESLGYSTEKLKELGRKLGCGV